MNPDYALVGFDRRTGFAEAFHPLPPEVLTQAMRAAGLSAEAAAYHGDWPVPDDAARQIAAMTGAVVDTDRLAYCLAPYVPLPSQTAHPRAAE
jgi:hypothetical protein